MVDIDHEAHQYEVITEEIHNNQPFRVPAYEPTFPRESLTRRVLAFITDDVDGAAGGVPRNTPAAVGRVLFMDGEVGRVTDPETQTARLDLELGLQQVGAEFDRLHEAGFIEHRDDDSYALTEAGYTELFN